MIEKRRILFRKEKRSPRWHTFKKKTEDIIKARRAKFAKELKEKFLLTNDSKKIYAHVQSILSENEPSKWSVKSLDTSKTESELAEAVGTLHIFCRHRHHPQRLTPLL